MFLFINYHEDAKYIINWFTQFKENIFLQRRYQNNEGMGRKLSQKSRMLKTPKAKEYFTFNIFSTFLMNYSSNCVAFSVTLCYYI